MSEKETAQVDTAADTASSDISVSSHQVIPAVSELLLAEPVQPETFKQRMLRKTEELGIDEDFLAAQMAHVIKGVTIRKEFERHGTKEDGTPNMTLKSETLSARPEDMLRGLMFADVLRGGELGLVPKDRVFSKPSERVHKRLTQDPRIVVQIKNTEGE